MNYLWQIILGSGYVGLMGWGSLLLLACVATWAFWAARRHAQSTAPDLFFGAAHVQILFFLLANGIQGVIYSFAYVSDGVMPVDIWVYNIGQILFSIGVDFACVAGLAILVALGTGRRPQLDFPSALGAVVISADVALSLALPMRILVETH